MAKIYNVIDTEKWVSYPKAKYVSSEFKIPYQKLTQKLGGSEFNDTKFVYGYLYKIENETTYKSIDGKLFTFKYLFYNKNILTYFYIVEIENKLIKISKDNGDKYLLQLIEL